MEEKILIKGLQKYYGSFHALKGIDLTVEKGEILGIVGPNGSGKTTLIECILGLRRYQEGSISVFGLDTQKDHRKAVWKIGAQLQETEISKSIRVQEAVCLQAAIYGKQVNVQELLSKFGIESTAKKAFNQLSGGQKQKLFILLAQIHDPDVLIFDELSTGLDPLARRSAWDDIRELKNRGKTVLLSSHFMEEVEALCDKVLMIKDGTVLDFGTPAEMIGKLPYRYVVESRAGGHTEFLTSDEERDKLLRSAELVGGSMLIRSPNFDDYYRYRIGKPSEVLT